MEKISVSIQDQNARKLHDRFWWSCHGFWRVGKKCDCQFGSQGRRIVESSAGTAILAQ